MLWYFEEAMSRELVENKVLVLYKAAEEELSGLLLIFPTFWTIHPWEIEVAKEQIRRSPSGL